MSLLIKDMEMPTRCFACPMCDVDNAEVNCVFSHGFYIEYRKVDMQIAIQARPDWCPIIEVPPHGDLIDRDALFKEFERIGWFNNSDRDIAEDALLDAPTIIEAGV